MEDGGDEEVMGDGEEKSLPCLPCFNQDIVLFQQALLIPLILDRTILVSFLIGKMYGNSSMVYS